MRHFILIGLLAAASAACQDAAAPREAGRAALSQAGASTRLDLQAERASLIAAGNALSSAAGRRGVVAALDATFASDVLFLSPRVNTLEGRAAARRFLASDSLAPSALRWDVVVADVSSDGAQGYTWGEGVSTYDFGTGPLERPSFFLIYWRRAHGEPWKVAAMVVNLGGPQTAGIPAGFGTPTTRHSRGFPHSSVPAGRARLLGVDAAFSALSVRRGTGPAFKRFAAPNAIAVSGQFVFGPDAIGAAFASEPGDTVNWVSRFSGAAESGDLGFTVGGATFNLVQSGTFYSKYLTVWRKQDTGEWRYVADLGNSRPR